MSWIVEKMARNVCRVHITYTGSLDQRFLLSADRHWDNPLSNQELQTKHLDIALGIKAGVIDVGDFFCAMQGKFDKRASKASLRPEHKMNDYLDALVETADEFFAKWAKLFVVIGMGNHETSILSRHEVNLTNNLCTRLNKRGSKVFNGGFSGWVHFILTQKYTNEKTHFKLHYHHGYGGGGPVTRDVIQSNRQAVYLPDADIVVSGHTHDEWQVPIAKVRLGNDSRITRSETIHLKVPTYKDEYRDGFGGFHIEIGRAPRPIGAAWIRFFAEKGCKPDFEILRAK